MEQITREDFHHMVEQLKENEKHALRASAEFWNKVQERERQAMDAAGLTEEEKREYCRAAYREMIALVVRNGGF